MGLQGRIWHGTPQTTLRPERNIGSVFFSILESDMSRLSSIKCLYTSFVQHRLVGLCVCGYRSGQTNLSSQILQESIKSSISIADTITPKTSALFVFS